MKPGYKIIIAGLLVYGGFKIKATMDVAPYKERAVLFTDMLKQQHGFEAQALLSRELQGNISIEKIHQLIQEYNLTEAKEVEWREWQEEEGNYTLEGAVILSDEIVLPVTFLLRSPEENETWIEGLSIGKDTFPEPKSQEIGFLE